MLDAISSRPLSVLSPLDVSALREWFTTKRADCGGFFPFNLTFNDLTGDVATLGDEITSANLSLRGTGNTVFTVERRGASVAIMDAFTGGEFADGDGGDWIDCDGIAEALAALTSIYSDAPEPTETA
jgi:hypothetical protein